MKKVKYSINELIRLIKIKKNKSLIYITPSKIDYSDGKIRIKKYKSSLEGDDEEILKIFNMVNSISDPIDIINFIKLIINKNSDLNISVYPIPTVENTDIKKEVEDFLGI